MSIFNQNKINIDKSDIQKIYKRQLELVKEIKNKEKILNLEIIELEN